MKMSLNTNITDLLTYSQINPELNDCQNGLIDAFLLNDSSKLQKP